MAANGSNFQVVGEVRLPTRIKAGFDLSTTLLISDQIKEPVLGMDWLRDNRCRIMSGTGTLFLGRKSVSLVRGNGNTWCLRIIVAEEVLVFPKH